MILPTDEEADAAAIAYNEYVLGDEYPLTPRELGIARQAWRVAIQAAYDVKNESEEA